MNLKITYPDDFPLHGLDRDMFEAKLRDALRIIFAGNAIRQLAERLDARRPVVQTGALPLRQIGNDHSFEECMGVNGCRLDEMSVPLRRNLLRNVGARLGLTISEWGDNALPALDELVSDELIRATDDNATNRHPIGRLSVHSRSNRRASPVWLAAGLCAAAAIGGAAWNLTRPAAPLTATVVSMSPAQTLRELASSVPDDRRPYRVSVQIEPQDTNRTLR